MTNRTVAVTSPPRPPPSVALSSLGAVHRGTGRRFLVEHDVDWLLVDAGLFPGPAGGTPAQLGPTWGLPDTLDAIVLTHAHLDHSGYLPRLVRDGFAGPVL